MAAISGNLFLQKCSRQWENAEIYFGVGFSPLSMQTVAREHSFPSELGNG